MVQVFTEGTTFQILSKHNSDKDNALYINVIAAAKYKTGNNIVLHFH